MRFKLLLLVLLASGFAPASPATVAAEIWVATDGSDDNPGTSQRPLKSPATALRRAREMRRLKDPAVEEGVRIVLRGGVYQLDSPLRLHQEDSGSAEHPTLIQAAPGESPVLSGGIRVRGWRPLESAAAGLSETAAGKVWTAEVPRFHGRPLEFRQMWVNDRKAVRAREPDGPQMARLTRWLRDERVAGVPLKLADRVKSAAGLEMTVLQMWEIAHLRVERLELKEEDAEVRFHHPESELEFEHPWPQPVMEPEGAPFFVSGRLELLDQPGEWHVDRHSGRIYYWPRDDEDLRNARTVVPALETIVQVEGTVDRPVSHVSFRGIGFQHSTWLRPSYEGHVPLQAGMYLTEAYKLRPKGTPEWRSLDNQAWIGRPSAAVLVDGAHHIEFDRCRFTNLASTGIDFRSGTHDDLVRGCIVRDVGGNGIQIGCFQDGAIETHLPYNPSDRRVVCQREIVENNLVSDCGTEDWGCVGICVGYASEVEVRHNEVCNLPYTGISVGWGWTRDENALGNNRVAANHIHHIATRMADTAGVYTLSAQPGTVIEQNHIHSIEMSPFVHDPEHWFYLYLDEGSSFITVRNNWCPAERFFSNAVGTGNKWENNGPGVAEEVRTNAGLQADYADLMPSDSPPSGDSN